MSSKTPAILSAVLTAIGVFLSSLLLIFSMLIALNGVSERTGTIFLGLTLGGQVAGGIPSVILAWRLTHRLITKSNWKNIPAVIVAFLAGITTSGFITFLFMVIAILITDQT